MGRKRFTGAIENRGNNKPTPTENVSNAMYGGDVNNDALNDFFDSLAQDKNPSGQHSIMRVVSNDYGVEIGKFTITPMGLQIADGVDADEWQAFGQHIRTMETSIQWIIGDWLAYGERVHGATYQEVAELTGYAYETLRNLVWVARQFDLSYRYDKLSHTHHQKALLACGGNVDVARGWLERASDNDWAVKRMLDEIAGNPPTPPLVSGSLDKFWRDFEGFSKKHTQIAGRVGEAERRQMADALRKLADDLERTKK